MPPRFPRTLRDPELLERLAQLCRQGSQRTVCAALPSGFPELDANLPGGGWPLGAITELLSDTAGIGELSLLAPGLSKLARAGRHLVWIAPPYLPYAPALAQRGVPLERLLLVRTRTARDALWATEQALRCPTVGAVLGWPEYLADQSVRRLQLAAEAGGTLGILYRSTAAAATPSPAALRLRLQASASGLQIEVHKARGARAGHKLQCRLDLFRSAPLGPSPDALAVPATAAARA